MNAHTQATALHAMADTLDVLALLHWHESDEAKALLASCVANPPIEVPVRDFVHRHVIGYAYSQYDPRVEALNALVDAAFLKVEGAGGVEAVRAFRGLDVDAAIDAARQGDV